MAERGAEEQFHVPTSHLTPRLMQNTVFKDIHILLAVFGQDVNVIQIY